MNQRPSEVKAAHIALLAIVYLRQSTDEQVRNNTGSTHYQRSQVRFPTAWGWQSENIITIDDDLGLSGSAAGHRAGYQKMVAHIEAAEVGAIFLSDLTRGGRDATEWFRLLHLCRQQNVLIVVDGKVYDVNDSGEMLMAQLMTTLGEHENRMRREQLKRGRLAMIEKGFAVTAPPTGYVRRRDGSWEKDPDPGIVASIIAVFRTFKRERSCHRTVKALLREGVKLIRRSPTGELRAVDPKVGTVYNFLTNPAYVGDYCYGRRKSDPRYGRDRRGHPRLRRADEDNVRTVVDHHEPYVTREVWADIQSTLKLNGPSTGRRNLGPGSGLLQGIIRCGMHRNMAMVTVYKTPRRDGGRSHAYYCIGDYHHGGRQCGHAPGEQIDSAVIATVLARLTPPRLEVVRDAVARVGADQRSERHRERLELNRLQKEAVLLEDKFITLDPSSTELAKSLETRLEGTRRQIRQLERKLAKDASHAVTFSDDMFAAMIDLCGNVRALWDAPTTTYQDRKQILRLLIKHVIQEHRDLECIRLRIVWTDGTPDTAVTVNLGGYVNRVMLDMLGDGDDFATIAAKCNQEGIPTGRGREWTAHTVAHKLRRLQRHGGRDRRTRS